MKLYVAWDLVTRAPTFGASPALTAAASFWTSIAVGLIDATSNARPGSVCPKVEPAMNKRATTRQRTIHTGMIRLIIWFVSSVIDRYVHQNAGTQCVSVLPIFG